MTPFTRIISFFTRNPFAMKSLMNTDAADGGLWHQDELCRRLSKWRSDPIGAPLAISLFGLDALKKASFAGAHRMEDLTAKPDLRAWIRSNSGLESGALISAKLISAKMTSSISRANHHAARVKFEDAHLHGLLPADDFQVRGSLLEHFIDGEALSRQSEDAITQALHHFKTQWPLIARCALQGFQAPYAEFLVISIAEGKASEQGLTLIETRCCSIDKAIEFLVTEPPSLSSPRDGQVGTIGSSLMHLQRGQALSLGVQRDIQIKINAQALFNAMPSLELP